MSRESFEAHIVKSMSENTWRQHIRQYADDCGFHLKYHTGDSRRSDLGFPDDALMHRSGLRLVVIEAKRESGKLSYEQVLWLDSLAVFRDAGMYRLQVYVARPSDRDALWIALENNSQSGTLHQWCCDLHCTRCQNDRGRATPPKRVAVMRKNRGTHQ